MTVRGFYTQLGIPLPDWSQTEAPVRCFADPDAHRRGDRSPSCSVNLITGAFNCHGCGAHGGPYDAALATGHTPRSAMALLIAHDLAQPRPTTRTPRRPPSAQSHSDSRPSAPPSTAGRMFAATEHDVADWAARLDRNGRLIRRLALERGWAPSTICDLQLGHDGTRITIPIHDHDRVLQGVLRYDPFGCRDPKMLAVLGTRLGLIPHPAREPSRRVILVEGPPDMIAARSCGLPAIAIPGTSAWQPSWAQLLAGRQVTIVMDCDPPGRQAAAEIAASLHAAAITAEIVDLWSDRDDGYDLTDRILRQRRIRTRPTPRTIASLLRPVASTNSHRALALARTTQEATP